MNHAKFLILLAVSLLELVMCTPCDEVREPIHNYADGLSIAQAERRPLLVFVTQKNCPPCRLAKRVLESMRQDDELRNCVLVEMDSSEPQARSLMLGRKLTPQLILIDTRFQFTDRSVKQFAIETIDKARVIALLDRLPRLEQRKPSWTKP